MPRIARVLCSATLGWLAGLAFGPVFGGPPGPGPFLMAVSAVAVEATLVALAAALLPRLPAALTTGVGAGAVVATAMLATGAVADLPSGPWRLLTGALPADAAGPPLAAVVVVAGWSSLAAGLLAAYATNPLPALAPSLLCLVAALGLGASGPPLPPWYGLAFVALTVGLLVSGRPVPPSRAVAGVAGVTALAAVAAAALVGPMAPGVTRPPVDARALVAAPVQPRSGVSPLQQYLALRNGIRPLKLTGTVSRSGSVLRMVALTTFDGVYWTVAGDYRRAGTTLPWPGSTGDLVAVTQRVTVEAGELDWILAAGRPTSVSVPGLGVDEGTGSVAVPVDVTPPTVYEARSAVSEAQHHQILAADPEPARDPMPAPPPQIRSFLDSVVGDQPAGSDQLLALYRAFTKEGGFRYDQSDEPPGGHGYYQIQRLLTAKRGTSEQYASAYAVLARALGHDARVVMGFRPRYDRANPGAFVVTGADVDAWVEVNFSGLGWISIDPSPRDNPIGTRAGAVSSASRSSPLDDPLQDTDAPPQPPPPDAAEGDDIAGRSPGASPGAWLALASGLILVLLLGAGTPAAKTLRRVRRRRARSDRMSVLGAWRETLDRLREAGLRVTPAQTTGEVVALAVRARAAADALPTLAVAADRAAYAPEEPGRDQRDHAWSLAAGLHRQVRSSLPPLRRIAAAFDPRPLLGIRSHRPASEAGRQASATHTG
jgi:protein-glutamine gamma-glutamyltransferase